MLTILDAEGNAVPFDVSVSIEIENLKALVEADLGIPTEQQAIHFQGKELVQGQETLESHGVKEGDLLLVNHKKSMNPEHTPASAQQPWTLGLLNDNLALQNPSLIDVEIQKKIEEAIRQERVDENLHHAFEYSPESFVRVSMLYINMKVNNHPVKAFVDCGAQNTIISPESAEKSGIMRLLDTRYSGTARGVGTAKILGRIHSAQIQLGPDLFLPCSFEVVEGRGESLLFGLDMLKRYQACIDLKKNALVIQEREIPFLPENEIPKESFDSYLGNTANDVESTQASGGDESITTGGHAQTPSGLARPEAHSPQNEDNQKNSKIINQQDKIKFMQGLGIPNSEASKLLNQFNGNIDLATSFYFQ